VTPDIATFGKSMANGMPLSAVVGKEEYMTLMQDIFFSTTFGGETLSLAAAAAVLDRIERDAVPDRLAERGRKLADGLRSIIERHGLSEMFSLSGQPSWSFLNIASSPTATTHEIKTLLLQELFERGILFLGTHNLSAAHTDAHVERLLSTYAELLPWIFGKATDGGVASVLKTEPLVPLFTVR
jgi:glutamate-1-semialdehyde 2,1-aminomutase